MSESSTHLSIHSDLTSCLAIQTAVLIETLTSLGAEVTWSRWLRHILADKAPSLMSS